MGCRGGGDGGDVGGGVGGGEEDREREDLQLWEGQRLAMSEIVAARLLLADITS